MRITNVRRLIAAIEQQSWAIVPEKLQEIMAFVERRLDGVTLSEGELRAMRQENQRRSMQLLPIAAEASADAASRVGRGSAQKAQSVALIQLFGVISPRMNMLTYYSGGTSVQDFLTELRAAANDDSVAAIVVEAHTPGGSVYAVEEAAQVMFELRSKKPIYTHVNYQMASAGYWIGSAGTEIIAAPSADVGSIGVYMIHTEYSKADEEAGITSTIVRAGKYKIESNPIEPLTEEARSHLQEMVDENYDAFVNAVARHREVKPAAVRSGYGQGRVLTAKAALAEGMIDRIATLEELLAELGVSAGSSSRASAEDEQPRLEVIDAAARAAIETTTGAGAGIQASAPIALHTDVPGVHAAGGAAVVDGDEPRETSPASEARETEMDPSNSAAHAAAGTGGEGGGTAVADSQVRVGKARDEERKRASDIMDMCRAHGVQFDKASEYISSEMSVAQVGLDIARRAKENLQAMTASAVDVSPKETRRYSISRAILGMAAHLEGSKGPDFGYEREISEEIAKNMPSDFKRKGGLMVPNRVKSEAASRFFPQASPGALAAIAAVDPAAAARFAALNTGAPTEGGNAVFTQAGDLIDMLRPRMKVAGLGATILSGLTAAVAFPKQSAAGTWSWVAEDPGADGGDTEQAIAQVALNPKSGTASTAYSRQLLQLASIDVDAFVMNDLQLAEALGIDKAAIQGASGGNSPTGITNTAGIGLVPIGTNGGVPTYNHIVDLETEVAVDDADIGAMAYLTTPGIRGRLKKTQMFDGTNGLPVWFQAELNGYRAEVSTQVPANLTKGTSAGNCHAILFGVWSQLLIGYWGAYELLVDPYTLKKQALIEVTIFDMAGTAVRHPQAFAAVLDATLTPPA